MPLKNAIFSSCRTYRYVLRRSWDDAKPTALFVLLNPSTADETNDDPTIRRCTGFGRDWGFGGIVVANLFAYRSTDPNELRRVANPIGPLNDQWLRRLTESADLTVAAWGSHGTLLQRAEMVMARLSDVYVLGVTKSGQPRHPLYLRRSATLTRI